MTANRNDTTRGVGEAALAALDELPIRLRLRDDLNYTYIGTK